MFDTKKKMIPARCEWNDNDIYSNALPNAHI